MLPREQRTLILEQRQMLLYWTTAKFYGGSCCPLCSGEHMVCRFTAGTLNCVMENFTGTPCTNPHHRRHQ